MWWFQPTDEFLSLPDICSGRFLVDPHAHHKQWHFSDEWFLTGLVQWLVVFCQPSSQFWRGLQLSTCCRFYFIATSVLPYFCLVNQWWAYVFCKELDGKSFRLCRVHVVCYRYPFTNKNIKSLLRGWRDGSVVAALPEDEPGSQYPCLVAHNCL